MLTQIDDDGTLLNDGLSAQILGLSMTVLRGVLAVVALLAMPAAHAAVTIVQASAVVSIEGWQTRDVSLAGVVAGNSIVCPIVADSGSLTGITFTSPSYSSANAAVDIYQGSHKRMALLTRHNVAAGSHTITITQPDSTFNVFGSYMCLEVSGLANQNALAIPSNTAQGYGNSMALTSGTLPSANMLLIAELVMGAVVNPMNITTPSGYTLVKACQWNSGAGCNAVSNISRRIVAATTAQSLSYTAAGTENYAIALFGLLAAAPTFTAPNPVSCTGTSSSVISCTHGSVSGADHYIVAYRPTLASGSWNVLPAFVHSTLSYDFGGYTPSTQGCYRFAAANVDESTIGPWSDGTCGTTLPAAGSTAPNPVSCTGISSSVISCTHGSVSGADHYIVAYRPTLASGSWNVLPAFNHSTLSYDFGGYTPSTQGCYRFASANVDESSIGPWSDGACGTTLPASSAAVKWKPGHLVWVGSFLRLNDEDAVDDVVDRITNEICPVENIKGVQIATYWTGFEQQYGVYTFDQFDRIVDAVAACNKYVSIHLKERDFGQAWTGTPDLTYNYPAYLLTSTYGSTSGTSNAGGVVYSPPYVEWSGNLRSIARVWNPAVMDRIIALFNAINARYDSNPAVNIISIGETAIGVPGDSGLDFDADEWETQLKRFHDAMAVSGPHTISRIVGNFAHDGPGLLAKCASLPNCMYGGPDPDLPQPIPATGGRPIQMNMQYRGFTEVPGGDASKYEGWQAGGTDYRPLLGFIGETQGLGLVVEYFETPAEIQAHYTDNMQARIAIWSIDVGIYDEIANQWISKWPEILAQINADGTLYTTACPPNFPSCQ